MEEKTICFYLFMEKDGNGWQMITRLAAWFVSVVGLFSAFGWEYEKMSVRLCGVFEFEIVSSISDLLFKRY